jgi:hypothetical protein
MPTPTYTALANITLGSSASSVTFSSIPATYRDLVVVSQALATTSTFLVFRVNGNSSNVYNNVHMVGYAGITGSFSATNTNSLQGVGNLNTAGFGNSIAQLMDYSATDKHKSILMRIGDPSVDAVTALAGRVAITDAINSVNLSPNAGSFASGSTFALYGIAS